MAEKKQLEENVEVKLRQRVTIPIGSTSAEFVSFKGLSDKNEHVALIFKGADRQPLPMVRVHSECFTGDIFGSMRCDCGNQLDESIRLFSEKGGIILYLRQEGRGIGLYNKLDAYKLQDHGLDTYEANHNLGFDTDLRDYQVAAEMLRALGLHKIHLLTNNPLKVAGLEKHKISITRMINTGAFVNENNINYLKAKVEKTGHKITLEA